VLDQSPDDQVTAFSHARWAYTALTEAGATVQMSVYRGGHGWQVVDNSTRLLVAAVTDDKVQGERALHLQELGALPLDLISQQVALRSGTKLRFSCQVKTKDCKNAFLKLWVYDRKDQLVAEDVDVAQLRGSGDWRKLEKFVEVGKGTRAVVQLVMVLGGEVWLDDCRLESVE